MRTQATKTAGIILSGILALLLIFLGLRYTPAFHPAAASAFNRANSEVLDGNIKAAIADYQIADFLNPSNHAARHNLADLYVTQGNLPAAIDTLHGFGIGESGLQIAQLQMQIGQLDKALDTINNAIKANKEPDLNAQKSRILLEQGKGSEALDAAKQGGTSDDAVTQLGICYLLNDKPTEAKTLAESTSSAQAVHDLGKAMGGKYPFASLLYATGLPRSAERILNAYALTSAVEYRLLGQSQIAIAASDHGYWDKARTTLEKATAMDPANLDGHKLLLNVYQNLNLKDQANQQQTLIDALQSGKV